MGSALSGALLCPQSRDNAYVRGFRQDGPTERSVVVESHVPSPAKSPGQGVLLELLEMWEIALARLWRGIEAMYRRIAGAPILRAQPATFTLPPNLSGCTIKSRRLGNPRFPRALEEKSVVHLPPGILGVDDAGGDNLNPYQPPL